MSAPVVIAGGGLAAQRCAEALRRGGHEGRLHVVCAEPVAPYDRPPLSKELLAGERDAAELRFRDDAWYAEHDVELLLGVRATGLDPVARRLELGDGSGLDYSRLVIATGAAARMLPAFAGHANVHTLRDLADAESLRRHLIPGARVLVVGGGFVGLEVASTARALGAQATVVEAAPAPLAGPLGHDTGTWFADLHRRNGVPVHTDARIARVLTGAGGVHGVELEDSKTLDADVVLVAVGAAPDTRWLAGAGLPHDGVPVGPGGTTALPDVFAAGDVARPLDPVTGQLARREHWESAVRGAGAAARSVLGLPARPEPPAGFWSDQHGVRIQLVGEPANAHGTTVDGDPAAADFSVTYWRGDRPAAVLLVGRPAELPQARRLVADAALMTERSAA